MCKNCSRQKTCEIKEKPPANCGRFQRFSEANSPTPRGFSETKVFDVLDREIRGNKPVVGPL